MTSLQ